MIMTMAFNYGGRAEIVDAVKAIAAEGVPAAKIDEKTIRRHLYLPDMPTRPRHPDFRRVRISNFLLWELAYQRAGVPRRCGPTFAGGTSSRP